MDEDRKNWPVIIGVTAGIVGGIIAGLYIYSARQDDEPDNKLRDAQEIIAQCHERIKELETGLKTLREPSIL